VSALILLAASTASAQRAQTRGGFWGNFGLGWATLGCEDCFDRIEGAAGVLALGGTLSSKWQLGGAVNTWTRSEDDATLTVGLVSVAARFYPSATGGFHLLGGLGVASIEFQVGDEGPTLSGRETGTGAVLGLGYDIRLGRLVSLTPFANWIGTRYDGGGDLNFAQLGLSVTIH
jgi:hypothetical protein